MLKKLLLVLLFITTVLNATAPIEESVAKLYIATFDRAPDAKGLEYWLGSGLSIEEIAKSFFDQEETQEKYPAEYSNEDFIIEVYRNLFDRDPDDAGLDYWIEELESGRVTRDYFILTVMNGAKGDDEKILDNKTEVGLAFAHDGRNDADEAHKVLEGVTADPASVDKTLCEFGLPGCPNPELPADCPDGSSFITHNGTNYCPVTSTNGTGKVWLDRNLGATQVCTTFDDSACYGDYYQWGRNFDGHQNSTSGTTDIQATILDPVGHGNFITSSETYDYDWAHIVDELGSTRAGNWSKTDGTSVCPMGYRVPTEAELAAETTGVANNQDAFASFLKSPSAGYRNYPDGSVVDVGSWGSLWSASTGGSRSRVFYFVSGDANWGCGYRAFSQAVRCLRD